MNKKENKPTNDKLYAIYTVGGAKRGLSYEEMVELYGDNFEQERIEGLHWDKEPKDSKPKDCMDRTCDFFDERIIECIHPEYINTEPCANEDFKPNCRWFDKPKDSESCSYLGFDDGDYLCENPEELTSSNCKDDKCPAKTQEPKDPTMSVMLLSSMGRMTKQFIQPNDSEPLECPICGDLYTFCGHGVVHLIEDINRSMKWETTLKNQAIEDKKEIERLKYEAKELKNLIREINRLESIEFLNGDWKSQLKLDKNRLREILEGEKEK